jgi:hypothetical protein
MFTPHVLVELILLAIQDGGLKASITVPIVKLIARIGDCYHDCGIDVSTSTPLYPGESTIAPVEFLCPDLVMPKLTVGDTFDLWHGRVVGHARVLQLFDNPMQTSEQ